MTRNPTFDLSSLKTGEELGEYLAWIRNLRNHGKPRARLVVKVAQENLPLAILWHDHQITHVTHGAPLVSARMEGSNTLSGLLIWLAASHARAIARNTVVDGMRNVSYGSPLYDMLVEKLSRHVIFTEAEANLYGGSPAYRHVRATILLNTCAFLNEQILRKNFCTILG